MESLGSRLVVQSLGQTLGREREMLPDIDRSTVDSKSWNMGLGRFMLVFLLL